MLDYSEDLQKGGFKVTNPNAVAHLASALHEGLRAAGMAGVGKHFPGHGDTHVDSHRSPLLVISPYSAGGLVHRFANTTDVLATIEQIRTENGLPLSAEQAQKNLRAVTSSLECSRGPALSAHTRCRRGSSDTKGSA